MWRSREIGEEKVKFIASVVILCYNNFEAFFL